VLPAVTSDTANTSAVLGAWCLQHVVYITPVEGALHVRGAALQLSPYSLDIHDMAGLLILRRPDLHLIHTFHGTTKRVKLIAS
jgi:hypothetical protein